MAMQVLLNQAAVRQGVLLLDAKSLKVLGGRVDSLAEAWEAQVKFGGTDRRAHAGGWVGGRGGG
jgi:tudor domain-containing protein 3